MRHPDCPRTIDVTKTDEYVWSKVCEALDRPENLIAGARRHVEQLRRQAEHVNGDARRLQDEIAAIAVQRQWVITQARQRKIPQADMNYQLGAMSTQEAKLKHDLAAAEHSVQLDVLSGWEEAAREFLADLKEGLDDINSEPTSEEDRLDKFNDKRRIVQLLVERVNIGRDRKLDVIFRLDVPAMLRRLAQNKQAGICSRIRSFPCRRQSVACASPFRPAGR
jgi:hypothetical protein